MEEVTRLREELIQVFAIATQNKEATGRCWEIYENSQSGEMCGVREDSVTNKPRIIHNHWDLR